MNRKPYIAHWREPLGAAEDTFEVIDREGNPVQAEVQTIEEHLENTAKTAGKFASAFGAEEFAYQVGLAHDIGKYSEAFQKRIWENENKTDHSSAGAREEIALNKKYGPTYLAAYCIAGHHAGLLNGGSEMDESGMTVSLNARLNKKLDTDYMVYKNEISLGKLEVSSFPKVLSFSKEQTASMKDPGNFSAAFWTRMVFSCLVDADFLDTEQFANHGKTNRSPGENIKTLLEKLDRFLKEKNWLNGKSGINKIRSGILKDCIAKGDGCAPGLYSLTVPTGGGKTVASLAFALHHAAAAQKRKIIYVIPYCSIIDQTANTFQDILGKENVLAHYSGMEIENDAEVDTRTNSMLLATENWDKPVVVTTAVQFFESLFANRTSQCRKLHNIANSVIIFDEAQTLPQPYLEPCIAAISELVENYSSTCVFCTATQPALNRFFENLYVNRAYKPLKIEEICHNTDELYQELKRVTYEKIFNCETELTDEELAVKLDAFSQVLCIVATRKQACNVYNLLQGNSVFHLSKTMTSVHLRKTISGIRKCLAEGRPCRVVTTSLIEAGVDLDFPVVFRAETGLDSIIQAGGRCNREGKQKAEDSIVYIFRPEEKYTKHLPASMKRAAQTMEMVTGNCNDIADRAIVENYFNAVYNNLEGSQIVGTNDGLDEKGIMQRFHCPADALPFADIAKDFKVIDSNTISVFVPQDEASSRLAIKLQENPEYVTSAEYRSVGKYCVNVYRNKIDKISDSIIFTKEGFAILAVPELYDENTGLKFESEGGFGIFA